MKFLEHHRLALTPLTPIHIGCGEDFEPTNYVIDDGVLFHFDPATVPLGEDERRQLLKAVAAKGEVAISNAQRFFFEHRAKYAGSAHYALPVTAGVANWYANRVGRVVQAESDGGKVRPQLEIERTAHHCHTGVAYLPGSSIKGSIRTAWLNSINSTTPADRDSQQRPSERASEVEKELLGGSFHEDPFRLVKVADGVGDTLASRVVLSVDRDKEIRKDKNGNEREKNLFVRREVIAGGQYRAAASELRFDLLPDQSDPKKTPRSDKRISGFSALATACNEFFLRRLSDDLEVIKSRRFAADAWVAGFEQMITALSPAMDAGNVMLLRVGRHSGAESVTIDELRWFEIRGGKKRPSYWSRKATTLWLAAEFEDARSEMLPFGWLLLELADAPEIAGLKAWCAAQPRSDMRAVRKGLADAREKAAIERARLSQRADEKRQREAEEAAWRLAEAQRLATLSEQGKLVEALRQKLERHAGRKQPVSGVLFAEAQALIKLALTGGWSRTDQIALADLISRLGIEKIDLGSRERDWKRNIRTLRGEA